MPVALQVSPNVEINTASFYRPNYIILLMSGWAWVATDGALERLIGRAIEASHME